MIDTKGNMRVVILTPYKRLLDLSGVTELHLPVESGAIGVLPGHAPMVTAIGTGVVVYTQTDITGFFNVSGGIAEITGGTVSLLVDVAEDADSIDVDRAKKALERAQNRLSANVHENIDIYRAESARLRALSRIEAADLLIAKNAYQRK
jgi:F-type H+-transporting ATPase subunit epsilon